MLGGICGESSLELGRCFTHFKNITTRRNISRLCCVNYLFFSKLKNCDSVSHLNSSLPKQKRNLTLRDLENTVGWTKEFCGVKDADETKACDSVT